MMTTPIATPYVGSRSWLLDGLGDGGRGGADQTPDERVTVVDAVTQNQEGIRAAIADLEPSTPAVLLTPHYSTADDASDYEAELLVTETLLASRCRVDTRIRCVRTPQDWEQDFLQALTHHTLCLARDVRSVPLVSAIDVLDLLGAVVRAAAADRPREIGIAGHLVPLDAIVERLAQLADAPVDVEFVTPTELSDLVEKGGMSSALARRVVDAQVLALRVAVADSDLRPYLGREVTRPGLDTIVP